MTTEEKRLALFKCICAGRSQKDIAEAAGLNPSYLSQILSGHKSIGERAAKNLEAKLGLRQGILVNPQGGNSLDSTPVASFFMVGGDESGSDPDATGDEAPESEINAQRILILRALIGDLSRADFCNVYNLNSSYITNIFNGVRSIGAKSARNLEQVLGLRPGVLEHPSDLDLDSDEKVQALYLRPKPGVSPKGRLLLKNLESMLELDVLTADHIDLLSSMAYQLALPRVEAISEGSQLSESKHGEPVVEIHFRVTLSHEKMPHNIVSVWATDRFKAKDIAAQRHPEWEVVQARISNNQHRSQEA